MNKKILSIVSMFAVLLFVGAVSVYAKSDNSKLTGEEHRSEVSKVVQELEKIADRDSDIKSEVKAVAEDEKSASEKVKEKIDAVEIRSGFKTFFVGSDYKNLGALRSELVTSDNHQERLNRAMSNTTDSSVKAELQNQINELNTIQDKAEAFVKSMEGKFSLFGWLVKLFD